MTVNIFVYLLKRSHRTTHPKNVDTQQFVVRHPLFSFIIPSLNVIVQA
ncbi:hypothetical protein [Nostoc sp.]